jgi:hypothetical protein
MRYIKMWLESIYKTNVFDVYAEEFEICWKPELYWCQYVWRVSTWLGIFLFLSFHKNLEHHLQNLPFLLFLNN